MALLGSLDPTKAVPGFADMESANRHLPDSSIRDVLLAHVSTVGQDITRLRDGVATSYDYTMDRLSGVYTRKLKIVPFGVGPLLAIAVNADTITIANALWHDSVLRDQIVTIASHTSTSNLSATGGSNDSLTKAKLQQDPIMIAEEALRSFPIGWDFNQSYRDLLGWKGLLQLGGLLLTSVALMLGVAFWFDLLSKFIHLEVQELSQRGPKRHKRPCAIKLI